MDGFTKPEMWVLVFVVASVPVAGYQLITGRLLPTPRWLGRRPRWLGRRPTSSTIRLNSLAWMCMVPAMALYVRVLSPPSTVRLLVGLAASVLGLGLAIAAWVRQSKTPTRTRPPADQ